MLLAPLYQILSLGLSAAAVTNYVQSGGAQTDTLDSDVHKRLNASLSTFSIAQLALLVGVSQLGSGPKPSGAQMHYQARHGVHSNTTQCGRLDRLTVVCYHCHACLQPLARVSADRA